MLAPWLLFPLVLGVLALGCGLAVERLSGAPLPGALVPPCGLAAIVVVGELATAMPATAQFTIPLVVALAVAGLLPAVLSRSTRLRGGRWAAGAAVVVFAVFAAPVVLSGEPTFAGYIKLDDTATFLALTDRVMEHGRGLAGLAPSSYETTLWVNLAHGYPIGSLIPLGVGKALVAQDGAWVYQPYLAFCAAMLALVLYELAGRVVRSSPLRAVAAGVGAQPALLYGFALWGGVKELAAAPLVALAAALVPSLSRNRSSWRAVLPFATSAAALVGVLSLGGALWGIVPVAAALVLAARDRRLLLRAGAIAVGLLLLSLPTLADARVFLSPGTEAAVRNATVLGNLVRPLKPQQLLGIWPTGDFRFTPSDLTATNILIGTAGVVAAGGLVLTWRRRAWSVLLYVGSAILATASVAALGSPWVAAKAYAIGSPAFLFAAALGAVALIGGRRRTEGTVALAAVAGGVLWSNALAYREVNLAPRPQLRELELIGTRFAGQGPALMTEYQPYGVRHFLRSLDAEGASELRRRPIPLRDGSTLDKGAYADLADFKPSAIRVYRTLVLRRSPLAGRPPRQYQLVWSGRFYDVWQRPSGLARSLANAGSGVPACAGRTRSSAAHVTVATPIVVGLDRMARPGGWPVSADGLVAHPSGPGTASASIDISQSARYSIWVGGSFRRRLAVFVDGRAVGTRTHQLNNAGQYTLLGDLGLSAGQHVVQLRYTNDALAPGSEGVEYGMGPVVVSRSAEGCDTPD
jgi:hypothetical protein